MEILSVRIDAEIKARLDALAESTARTKSWLAAEAVRQYVEANEWQIQAIEEAVAAVAEGRTVAHETVSDTWRQSLESGVLPSVDALPVAVAASGADSPTQSEPPDQAPADSALGPANDTGAPDASPAEAADEEGTADAAASASGRATRLRATLTSFVKRG